MASKKSASKQSGKVEKFASPRRLIIAALAVAGFSIMVYLSYLHFAEKKSFCDISEKVSCDVVTTSLYSEIFGIPVSLLGLGFFALVLLVLYFKRTKDVYSILFFLTLFMLIPSLYLTLTEKLFIGAYCPLCESSKILMLGILITAFTGVKTKISETIRISMPIVIGGVALAGIMYFAQTGTLVKRDYSPLVTALNEKGVVYYASFKCNNCKRQEKLLGEAYKELNHVECHPDGPGGNPELCLEKNIDHTPTFLIEKEGVEIERRVGLQSIKELSDMAGISPEEAEAK